MTEINLGKVYSVESRLSREIVEHYKSYGLERLTKKIRKDLPKVERYNLRGRRVMEIIYGCHRSRALYELGARKTEAEDYGIGKQSKTPVKLKDAKVLDRKQYQEWYERRQRKWDTT